MTDNRTTELLREGLTERGVEWKNIGGTTSGDGITEWLVDGMTCRAAQRVTVGIEHLALYIPVLTPEQAIAATLGSDKPPYDELLRCLENDWHISASWDGLRKFWCVELTEEGVRMRDARAEHGTLTADDIRDLIERHSDESGGNGRDFHNGAYVAIADELNARAERTCHNTHENRWFKCSACGYGFTDLYAEDESDINEQPRYCPNCGCKVVDA